VKRIDANYLYKYASKCNFIIETGAGGKSTTALAKSIIGRNAIFVSIELVSKRCRNIKNVEYMVGWSVDYADIIKVENKDFVEMQKAKIRYRRNPQGYIDREIAYGKEGVMRGEKGLIRKVLSEHKDGELDFFL